MHKFSGGKLVTLNGLIGIIIGGAFGITTDNILHWLVIGLLIGSIIGFIGAFIFNKFQNYEKLFRRRYLLLVFIDVLLVIYLFLPIYRAYQITHPVRSPVTITPSDIDVEYEAVNLTTADGVQLAAWYVPSQNGAAIIALHGGNGNRAHVLNHIQRVVEHGYGVLMFDLRGHGESGGEQFPAANDSLDVEAGVNYLQTRPDVNPDKIGGLGLSLGAVVMIQGAAKNSDIKAVIVDGTDATRLNDYFPLPSRYWGSSIMVPHIWMIDRFIGLFSGQQTTATKELVQIISPRPILFISTGQDLEQFVNQRFYEHAGPFAELWEMPEIGHLGGLSAYPEEYTQRIITFFDTHLFESE